MTWLRGLVRLFAAREQPPSPEDPGRHGVSVEARLSFDFAEGRTTVASSLAPEPLFRLPARPTGSLSSVRAGQDGRPALVLKLPMEWEG
ncbi:MAG TPA: hypothetical protein VNO81_05325, partial [Candidatus Nitrosotenuis sp.]|nr:hypothetical protein [Candidatus Nitrosotenuis sp.]